MGSITRHRTAVKTNSKRTVDAYLQIVINDVAYRVNRIDPGEEGTIGIRLEKRDRGADVYDLVRDHHGLIRCSCPSYLSTYDGATSTCKHGQDLVIVGLMDAPQFIPHPTTGPAYRPVAVEVAAPVEEPHQVATDPAPIADEPKAPAFDVEFYRAANAVSEGKALWLSHRAMYATDPLPAKDAPGAQSGVTR